MTLVHISNFVTNQLVASARTCCILYNVTLVLDFKIKKTKGGTFIYRMIHFWIWRLLWIYNNSLIEKDWLLDSLTIDNKQETLTWFRVICWQNFHGVQIQTFKLLSLRPWYICVAAEDGSSLGLDQSQGHTFVVAEFVKHSWGESISRSSPEVTLDPLVSQKFLQRYNRGGIIHDFGAKSIGMVDNTFLNLKVFSYIPFIVIYPTYQLYLKQFWSWQKVHNFFKCETFQ